MSSQIKNLSIFLLGMTGFILDRLIKNSFYQQLGDEGTHYIKNYGIAFGLNLPKVFLIVLTISLIFLLSVYFIKNWQLNHKFEASLIFLILLGAYSNLIDRFNYGFVIDYINLKIWPVFNIADMLVVVGATILVILKIDKKSKKIMG